MKRLKFMTLAALLALPLAACDEGDDDLGVTPPVTGTITGTVQIDGSAAPGITVSLDGGAQTATTGANGSYTFSNVSEGAHSVSLSNVPADATFPTISQAVVISASGQVATVDFSGQFIRTSAIFGTVTAGGDPIGGVTVTLSGDASASTTTDEAGQYSFGGLRAGDYVVAVSGGPGNISFDEEKSVTLSAGEVKSVPFTGQFATDARIRVQLFLDENDKNDVFDGSQLEDFLEAENIAVTLEGPGVGETQTVQTDENGVAVFTDLEPGTYIVRVDPSDDDIPAGISFGATATTITVEVDAGETQEVFVPFDIIGQSVQAFAFLGIDGVEVNDDAPVEDIIIGLYPTLADAEGLDNPLGVDTTDIDGMASFTFDREDDVDPSGGDTDNVVFARFLSSAADPFLEENGEDIIEIEYDPTNATVMAPDTFDFRRTRIVLGFDAESVTGEELEDWNAALWRNDTLAPTIQSDDTDEDGRVLFAETTPIAAMPDTFWMRLSGAQPQAAGNQFDQDPEAIEGSAVGDYLRVIHNGLTPAFDTVLAGEQVVFFETTDLLVRVYHEADDTFGFTGGDDFDNTDNVVVRLWKDGDVIRTDTAQASDGSVTFTMVPTDSTASFAVSARAFVDFQEVVSDTLVEIEDQLSGGSPATFRCPLGADTVGTAASCMTFAHKYSNTGIAGNVASADGTPAEDVKVRIEAAPTQLFVETEDTVVMTDSDGDYSIDGLFEGPYIVSIADSVTADGDTIFKVRPGTTEADTVDLEGNDDSDIVDFTITRGDTRILGVVVNDRDNDGNVVDPGEALEGVQLNLYRGEVDEDSLVATTTTNSDGEYEFNNLFEGEYVVEAKNTDDATVLIGFDSDGDPIQTQDAQTSGAPRVRGSHDPVPLPRWDYGDNEAENVEPTHFTFLFSNTEARGTVEDTGDNPVAGVDVTLRRCEDSVPPATSPMDGDCITEDDDFDEREATTDSNGEFSFQGLLEGVYEVDVDGAPSNKLYLLQGSGDIESATFTVP